MPFIEGSPLSAQVGPGKLWPPLQAADLARRLALTMEIMHNKGLVNLNLKPGNILMRGNGEPVIMDFGQPRGIAEDATRATASCQSFGSPAYIAPEQVMGDQEAMGRATDVYSLGVILFELLCGETPFRGDPVQAVYQKLHVMSPSPYTLHPGIPAELEGICLKAMAREVMDRFASMAEIAAALQGVLQGATQGSTPESSPEVTAAEVVPVLPGLRPKSQRSRSYWVVSGVVLAALVLGAVLMRPWIKEGPRVDPTEVQAAWARNLGRSVEEALDLGGGVTMEMVLIPPGKYLMGSPAGEPDRGKNEQQHEVEITKAFYLGKYEVTQEQYEALMEQNPSIFHGKRLPVERVSWEDATAFCKALTSRTGKEVRLPTEAEWEYACRAGAVTPFHFGRELNGKQANCAGLYPYGTEEMGPYKLQTCEVGSYAPNAWGLYDMHGNVWEWCADWYAEQYRAEDKKDPNGPLTGEGRVLRGGSWINHAVFCRAGHRRRLLPVYRDERCGFRVAFRLD
jgi:formylglycine-generating enzyme required for sulfatase activity